MRGTLAMLEQNTALKNKPQHYYMRFKVKKMKHLLILFLSVLLKKKPHPTNNYPSIINDNFYSSSHPLCRFIYFFLIFFIFRVHLQNKDSSAPEAVNRADTRISSYVPNCDHQLIKCNSKVFVAFIYKWQV